MKKFSFLIASLLFSLCVQAQAPQKFSYQTVIRNASNQLLVGQTVGIKISILQGSSNGSSVYAETHTPQTNANGLATIEIGGGTLLSGNFAIINWANGPFFVKTETDPNGGNNYTITNTSQLLSVPYALYAATAGNNTPGPQGPAGQNGANGQNGSNGQNGFNCWDLDSDGVNDASEDVNNDGIWNVADCRGAQGPEGNPASDDQNLSVSLIGDTLYIQNGGFVIIPGISNANNTGGGQTGITQHTCGADSVHNPAKTYGSMTDQQGNVYKTIVIGTQEWMAENLETTIYRNGDIIANVIDSAQWNGLSTGAWASSNYNIQNDCPYGKFYNWFAVVDPRDVCPSGWHLPTDAEWTMLIEYLGGNEVAGGKMKSTGTQYWNSPNQDATNESGFSGLPGGICFNFNEGIFSAIGNSVNWWSSSMSAADSVLGINLSAFNDNAFRYNNSLQYGLYVRCLRD